MQTFLPYPDFEQSARALDPRRLGKQRVEVLQVLRALTRPGYGWANHPAVLMWRGYEEALVCYGLTCCQVWMELGHGDTCAATMAEDLRAAGISSVRSQTDLGRAGALPPWLGDETLHRSHRSALVRKDPAHYRPSFGDVPHDLSYHWPVRSESVLAAEERKRVLAVERKRRALRRAEREVERARRRRSRAAKRGWRTRRANSRRDGDADPG